MSELLRTVNVDITKMLTLEQIKLIRATAVEFGKVFGYYADLACKLQTCNGNEVHAKGYHESRELYPKLPSALNQSARSAACGNVMAYNSNVPRYNKLIKRKNIKREKYAERHGTVYEPKPLKKEWECTIEHKGLSYSLSCRAMSMLDKCVTIGTIGKRIKLEDIRIPKWFDAKYSNKRFYSGHITIDGKSNEICLHITYVLQNENSEDRVFYDSKKPDIKELNEDNVIGIDRGIYHPIATSNGILISSKPYYAVQRRYSHNAETLKIKSTPSSRKRLRAQSNGRARYNRDINHCLSKQIANIPNTKCVVLEDLTNIVSNVLIKEIKENKRESRKYHRWLHAWNFKDLEHKIEYKCQEKGIYVRYVNPHQTSQKCSHCGDISFASRYKNWFRCPKCGHTEHADINGAKNIRDRYLGNLRSSLRVPSTTHDVPANN